MNTGLEAKIAALSDEIRRYPTPIARCDEQLSELLEQRARLLAEAAKMEIEDRPRFPSPRSEVDPVNDAEKRGLSPIFPACSPDNVWINDGGFNAA
jgi:chorismate mutase